MKGSTLNQSSGVGLIELLITMLILTTTLLTVSALQTKSLQYNQGAYFRSQANLLAYDIFDRIRVNYKNMTSYNATMAPFNGIAPVTTPLSSRDIYEWRQAINTRIPASQSSIACDSTTRVCTVIIKWTELDNTDSSFEYTTGF